MKTGNAIFEAYVEEVAIYNRWLINTKKKYGQYADDPFHWGRHDYEIVNGWNDAMKMVERVLGLTDDDLVEANRLANAAALQAGKSTPWNYWKETPVDD